VPPIGVIAGNGAFPFLVLRSARRLGHDVVVVAIRGEAFPELEALAAELGGTQLEWVSLGQLGRCIQVLKRHGVARAVMAGQVKHVKLFTDVMPDLTMLGVLGRLVTKNTDALISGIADALLKQGVTLMDSTELLADLLVRPGVLTRAQPSEEMWADFAFGYPIADTIGGLDIGQTIVVKQRAVVAVEAMEGTDEAIARGGRLAGPGARVVKVAKPRQDMRFDVPVIGLATIAAMREAGMDGLSVDAGRTLMLDGEDVLRAANEAGMVIVGRENVG
jgi:DUF1009 family protein